MMLRRMGVYLVAGGAGLLLAAPTALGQEDQRTEPGEADQAQPALPRSHSPGSDTVHEGTQAVPGDFSQETRPQGMEPQRQPEPQETATPQEPMAPQQPMPPEEPMAPRQPMAPMQEQPAAPAMGAPERPAADDRFATFEEAERAGPSTGYGVEVSIGGGVANFFGDELRDRTDVGGSWEARVAVGTRQFVGLEAAYVGGAYDIEALGLDDDALLVRNGAEGSLRLNVPILYQSWLFEPFATAGLGWSRFNIVNEDFNTSDVADEDDVFVIPLSAGVAAGYKGVLLDARFTYRPTFNEDLVGDESLQNWTLGANIGFEF